MSEFLFDGGPSQQDVEASRVFSVLLPVIRTHFFEEALDSILAQTWRDFELIVVDNEAVGVVRAIVESRNDPRLGYRRHESRRPIIEIRNRGLGYVKRPYFVLASDDNRYEPGFLAEMARLIECYPDAGLYHGRARIVDERGELKRLAPACPEFEDGLDFLWHRMAGLREHFTGEFCWPAEALRLEEGFIDFPDAWFTDEATAVRHAALGGVACSAEPCFSYRESSENLAGTAAATRKLEAINSYEDWIVDFLSGWQHNDATAARLDAIRARMPRRLARLRYRALLDPGAGGFGQALRLVAREGGRYRLSMGKLIAAGVVGSVGRFFDRGIRRR